MKQPARYRHRSPLIILLRLVGLAAVALGVWGLFALPHIVKLSTPNALQMVETQYVRQDLTTDERKRLNVLKNIIIGNYDQLAHQHSMAASVVVIGMPVVGVLLIFTTRLLTGPIRLGAMDEGQTV